MANLLDFSGSAADMLSAMKAAGMDVGTSDAQKAAIRVAGWGVLFHTDESCAYCC
jgi:hypothetical protein